VKKFGLKEQLHSLLLFFPFFSRFSTVVFLIESVLLAFGRASKISGSLLQCWVLLSKACPNPR